MILWQGPDRLAEPDHLPPEGYLARCRSDLFEYGLTTQSLKLEFKS